MFTHKSLLRPAAHARFLIGRISAPTIACCIFPLEERQRKNCQRNSKIERIFLFYLEHATRARQLCWQNKARREFARAGQAGNFHATKFVLEQILIQTLLRRFAIVVGVGHVAQTKLIETLVVGRDLF